jgi:hypothetical protein
LHTRLLLDYLATVCPGTVFGASHKHIVHPLLSSVTNEMASWPGSSQGSMGKFIGLWLLAGNG